MSIARTTDTDDDGSGTTGTIRNNAWLQAIYDVLDARWSRITITSTGTQNNLSIADANGHDADFVIFNNASDLTVTGIVAPSGPAKPGKPLRYVCIGAGNVYFQHQNAGSTAANRMINIATSGDTPHSGGSGCGILIYDDSASRWRLIAHEQGAWITPTYSAGQYTTTGGGSWTVDSGDVATYAYRLSGRTLTVAWANAATTTASSPVHLTIATPGGFTATKTVDSVYLWNDTSGGTSDAALVVVLAGGTVIGLSRDASSFGNSFGNFTNTLTTRGQITFEVN